jgi:glutamyl/glutaminyl-tRNA synthetase
LTVVGRLAPTPSGHLHLGNIVSFAAAWLSVRQRGGRLLLRIEDLDQVRASSEIAKGQREDLQWLGLEWDEEVPRQSARTYDEALDQLRGHTYCCRCTRKQVQASGPVYPGTCRSQGYTEGAVRLRLPPALPMFEDRRFGWQSVAPTDLGDPVLRRRDGLFGYPLAVVTDDIRDGVTEVVRGADLLPHSASQAYLWGLFGQVPPTWLHAPLVLGPDGRKLSKSHGSTHIGFLRATGATPQDVWRVVLPWLGLAHEHVHDAINDFRPTASADSPIQLHDTKP